MFLYESSSSPPQPKFILFFSRCESPMPPNLVALDCPLVSNLVCSFILLNESYIAIVDRAIESKFSNFIGPLACYRACRGCADDKVREIHWVLLSILLIVAFPSLAHSDNMYISISVL
jgi:hypothetical protein